jgi:mediator of RNA polymerase II transcription subunit 16
VNLQHLSCSPRDGQWGLSASYTAEAVSTMHSEHQLVNLCWNHSGAELAIADVFGRISVFVISSALNRIAAVRRCVVDPEDSLSALVGLMWLHTEKAVNLLRVQDTQPDC